MSLSSRLACFRPERVVLGFASAASADMRERSQLWGVDDARACVRHLL